MQKNKLYTLFITGLIFTLSSCEIDEVVNPNSPNLGDFLSDASEADINLLVAGLESRARDARGSFITATGSIARELYFFNSSDPTTTATLLGKEGSKLTGSEPQLGGVGVMGACYSAIKSADFILEAVAGTTDSDISTAEAQGYRAVANTFRAYSLLEMISLVNNAGLRVEISDPENLGPILSRAEVYTEIHRLLDDAFGELRTAEFAFRLSPGFAEFDTPATFSLFNRAIAARAAIYQEKYDDALKLVGDSFLKLGGDSLDFGVSRQYGNNGFEIPNPIFKAPQNSGDQYVVHNRFITEIRASDTRINKFRLRNDPVARDGVNGTHEIDLYADNATPIDHIRNEELILIYIEANIRASEGSLPNAIAAINILNVAYGLGAYTGASTVAALTDEMLYHRSYSLWGEGHAMFDLRRYNRLNAKFLPLDRAGDIIHTEFPLPPFDG